MQNALRLLFNLMEAVDIVSKNKLQFYITPSASKDLVTVSL